MMYGGVYDRQIDIYAIQLFIGFIVYGYPDYLSTDKCFNHIYDARSSTTDDERIEWTSVIICDITVGFISRPRLLVDNFGILLWT